MDRRCEVLIVTTLALVTSAAASTAFAQQPYGPDTCVAGYVWRDAFPNDHVCVTPDVRTQAAEDNNQAADRRQPGGGDYGPNTCLPGYVWRAAAPDDLVCVTPAVRDQAGRDNAAAASRRAASTPTNAPPPAQGYRTSEWSPWTRAAGIEYRYRWGWNPHEGRYANNVDAVFEMRSQLGRVWNGAARSLDCSQNVLWGSTEVVLQPHETRQVKFLTKNCGTLNRPSFRPNVVESGRFD